ncbi:MAG: outer membrane protein assembly factor BamD [Bacteroidota bacterium]
MRLFLIISMVTLLSACTEYSAVVKKGTLDQKYDMAVSKYKDKDYVRALPLFEELLAVYRGKEKAEEIYFYYSYCYYGLGQYELAAFHFKNFTENYYNSKHSEECAYMYVHCLYEDALPYYLDQTNTEKAISEMQIFLNQYPATIYRDLCNDQISELRKNLQKKSFENAMLFYKIEDFRAATISFKNTIKDFPDIDNKDEIEYMIIKASYMYAKYSVDDKKEERLKNVFTEFKEFSGNHPVTNKYYKLAEELNNKAKKDLEKHHQKQKISS